MKKAILSIALLLTYSVVSAGCATVKKASDEEMIQATVAKVKDSLEKKDLDALMTTFSENFKDSRAGGKAEAKSLLAQGLSSGYADNGKVSLADLKVTLAADKKTARVYPMDLSSPAGSIAVELTMTKEKDGWLITSLNAGGV